MGAVNEELAVVDALIQYLLSCLEEKVKTFVERIAEKRDLGINLKDGRLGLLFPDHLVDVFPGDPSTAKRHSAAARTDQHDAVHAAS
jgi:hypothetical protein